MDDIDEELFGSVIKEISYQQLEHEVCSSIKKLYNQLLDEFIILANTFNYRSALEISSLFEFLLRNEYIGNVNYDNTDNAYILEDEEMLGANTFAGGVCRHKSSMLKDVYHKKGIDSLMIVGSYLDNKFYMFDEVFKDGSIKKETGEVEYNDIKYYILNDSGHYFAYPCYHDEDFYEKDFVTLNHAIVLAGNERIILTDPTLYHYYYLEGNDKMAAKSRTGRYFFIAEPKLLHLQFYGPHLQNKFEKFMKRPFIPDDEIFKVSEDIKMHLNNSKAIIEEFINDNHESIDSIKEKCLYLRKTSKPYTHYCKN
jgi:hypothetical protein